MSKKKKGVGASVPAPKLQAFLHRIFYRVQLPKKETKAMKEDFLRLLAFYAEKGMDADAIEARIGDDILGTFYRPASPGEWYRLDSAAKVYPLSMTHTHGTMFRVSAYMKETVEPAVLQVALLSVLKRFPLFSTAMKRGVFWHYFDAVRCRFPVRPEKEPPCSCIFLGGRQTPCFRVLYHKKRIALEIFHVLTDGTGAVTFLKCLVREYLRLLGIHVAEGLPSLDESPHPAETENAFSYAEKQKKGTGFLQRLAIQPGAGKKKRRETRILHFIMPTDGLLAASKKEEATVTAFLTSCITKAVRETVDFARPEESIQVQVPVNMRRFYPTRSLRNFSLYAVVSTPYKVQDRAEMLAEAKRQLREQTEPDSLARMLYSANQMATNPFVRIMPLGLKGYVLKKIYGVLGEKVLSGTLSNLGKVDEDFGDHVQFFDFVLGETSKTNIKCTLVSYQNTAVLTVTDSLLETRFQESLARSLREAAVPFYIEGVTE
ncbi:MAG: hypothetical protein E7408_05090 [Ruminococcaceae bacterium]|nr:hypothetical protein [Oscillospiraceae bacterium]